MNWWRVTVSFMDEMDRRKREVYAFFDTEEVAVEKAIAQLGPDWESGGRVESVKKMDRAPFFQWRR